MFGLIFLFLFYFLLFSFRDTKYEHKFSPRFSGRRYTTKKNRTIRRFDCLPVWDYGYDWLTEPSIHSSIQRIVLWLLGWLEPASQPTTTHFVRGGSYAVVVLWRWLLAWIESTLRLGACLAITTRPDAFLHSPRLQQHGIIMPLATINNPIHLSQQHHH